MSLALFQYRSDPVKQIVNVGYLSFGARLNGVNCIAVESPFSTNRITCLVVIYAARIEQYRRAYVLFLRDFGQVISGLIRIKPTKKSVHFSLQDNVIYNINQNQSQIAKESVSIFKH